jgi:hypothetical protein
MMLESTGSVTQSINTEKWKVKLLLEKKIEAWEIKDIKMQRWDLQKEPTIREEIKSL